MKYCCEQAIGQYGKRTMVIAFLNQKGGTGKTTLAVHVACELARAGSDVLLLDADPQASASEWAGLRAETPCTVMACTRPNLHNEVAKVRDRFDHIVVDGPPRGDALLRSCLVAADLCVIPIEPSGLSVRAADRILAMVETVRTIRPGLEARFVVNRKKARTLIGRELRHLATGLMVLETEISDRIDFANAVTYGRTIAERAGDGHPGAVEIARLTEELLHIQTQEQIP